MTQQTEKNNNSKSKSDNIALIKRWYKEVWNDRRIKAIDEFMSPDFVGHYGHEKVTGIEHWKERFYGSLLTAIPNLSVEIKDIVAEGNIVVTRWKANGVFSEELFGVSPSNQEIEFGGISWMRVANGKIVENWNNWNMDYLFRQLLMEMKVLKGIVPLCSFCKKIRDDKGYWDQVELYIEKHSEAEFSHSICPECAKEHYPDLDLYSDDE